MQTKRKLKVVALLLSFVLVLCFVNSCKAEQNPNISTQSRIVGSIVSGAEDNVSVTSGTPNLPISSDNKIISVISESPVSSVPQNSAAPIDYMKLRRDAGIHQNSIEVNNDIDLTYDNMTVIGKRGINSAQGGPYSFPSLKNFFADYPFKCLRENSGNYYAVYISYANTVAYVVFKKETDGEIRAFYSWVYFESAVSLEDLKIDNFAGSNPNAIYGYPYMYTKNNFCICAEDDFKFEAGSKAMDFLKDGTTVIRSTNWVPNFTQKPSIYDFIRKEDYPEKIMSTFRSEAIVNKKVDNEIKLSYENLTTLGGEYSKQDMYIEESKKMFLYSPYKCLRENNNIKYTVYALPERKLLYVVFPGSIKSGYYCIYNTPSSYTANYDKLKNVILPQDMPEKILGLE